jgi:hypothetical protein
MPPPYRAKLWQLVLTVPILVFGAAVAWMVLHPRVSEDYDAYYIERTASCFPRITSGFYPLGDPISFVPASHSGYDLDTVRWCGFLPPSSTGIRSFGDYGILHLKFADPGKDLLLTFSSWVNYGGTDRPRREVGVEVNGEPIGTMVYTGPPRQDGKFIVPASVIAKGKGTVEIRFNVPRIGPAGTNGEPQTLQLRLESLRLAPIDDVAREELGTLSPQKPQAGSPPPVKLSRRG